MKRYIAILCVLACLVIFLAGCTEKEDISGGGETKNGILSEFSAESLSGDIVDQSVLEGKKVTMINIWGTFCGPCIVEMPHLAALNDKYQDEGFQVIGVILDATDMNLNKIPAKLSDANEIISSTGADYLQLLPSSSLYEKLLYRAQAIPLTVFVDEEGNMLGKEYLGAKSFADWERIVLSLLEGN